MDKKQSILETLALKKAKNQSIGKVLKEEGVYMVNGIWYSILWQGSKYAYCLYTTEHGAKRKQLLEVNKLKNGEYCPF